MPIKKWDVYIADLEPRHKAEPGKIRPVVVIQTNLLNNTHPTTIICPISSKIQDASTLLRVHLKKGEGGLKEPSDILIDQVRAIDNSRFHRHLGSLEDSSAEKLKKCLDLILD